MTKKLLIGLLVGGALVVAAPRVYAACGGSTPMIHGSTYLNCKDVTPVAGFAWQVSSPGTVNSGNEKIVCEAFDGNTCLGDTGTFGDGRVDVETDWANPTIVGCPVVGTTFNRVAVSVQANDGTGVILSVSGNTDEFGYLLDVAHPLDTTLFVSLPLDCSFSNGRPTVLGVTSSSISLRFNKPHVYSDCDPNSLGVQGFALGLTSKPACNDAFNGDANVTLGSIYTSNQACGTRPSVSRSSTQFPWTLSTVTPQADGTASIPYTKPADGTLCTYVGGTVKINGVETNSITGFVQIAGSLAPAPQAYISSAHFANGKVTISFQTDSEVGLAAINVLTDQKGGKGTVKVGSVALQGVGGSGSTYTPSFGKSEFKSGTTVTIELVTTDGRTTRSQTVAIK